MQRMKRKQSVQDRRCPSRSLGTRTRLSVATLVSLALSAGCGQDQPKGPPAPASDADTEFTTTPTGLKYKILRHSDGKKPSASGAVKAHYVGWLDDGTEFDNSYVKGKGPVAFPLNMVIPGWTEGLQLIGQGGMIELEIPSKLGYGERGKPPRIPPNSTLHFIVELDAVK